MVEVLEKPLVLGPGAGGGHESSQPQNTKGESQRREQDAVSEDRDRPADGLTRRTQYVNPAAHGNDAGHRVEPHAKRTDQRGLAGTQQKETDGLRQILNQNAGGDESW